jgi:hypothetical protein
MALHPAGRGCHGPESNDYVQNFTSKQRKIIYSDLFDFKSFKLSLLLRSDQISRAATPELRCNKKILAEPQMSIPNHVEDERICVRSL